ncbi:tyrosine-protein kinase [uncultured Pontibacter sp.]|uniref:GumC family protein n=1 Tax=uncultured Pontibacter sp. TaxID=453356 RepID=UPI0026049EF0|nr:tyrosine-protein kinase [uncultured Pontibacter sp.]
MSSNRELFPLKSEQPDAKDIGELVGRYLKYWYLFLIGGMLGVAGAYFYCLYYTVPQYSISSTILLKDVSNDFEAGALGSLSGINSSKNINNEIEVMYSLSFMQRVVKELDLSIKYMVEGRVKDVEIYGKEVPIKVIVSRYDSAAFGKSVSIYIKSGSTFELEEAEAESSIFNFGKHEDQAKRTQHKFGQQINRPYGAFTIVGAPGLSASKIPVGKKIKVVFQDIRKVAQQYNQKINISSLGKGSSILRISLIDPVPEKGKKLINKFVEVYNIEAIEDKNLQAASTIDFLDERLKYVTTELSDVEKDVELFKRKNELTDVSSQASQYVTQANGYEEKLSDWAIQIDILESIEEYIKNNNNQYRMVPSTLTIKDPTLSGLISKFNELQLERERILRNAFPNNPLVLNINEQLEDLRINITENLRNIKNSLVITSNNLRANSGLYQRKINKVPTMERELLEINRQQAIKQNLYLYLLQKREESAMSLAANVTNSRIVDPAISTSYPIRPDKNTIYLLFTLIGLAIPFGGIFLKELLNTKVQSQQDVERLTSTPILGEIMHNDEAETLVVTTGNRSPVVEMIRHIRAKLRFAAVDRDNKTILITSSMGGEGKTFFSINLGASLVLTGKKVILLELDMRKPKLTKDLGITEDTLGISDYLISDDVPIADIIKPVENMLGLYVISAGPTPPDPAELMMSSKLTHLISELKESFDYIIIDTAPVGLVADAFSLSPLIDSTIYIVRRNYTYKKQIGIIDEIYRNKELSRPAIVLNDVENKYGQKYGYEYGYVNKKKSGVLSKI